MDTALAILGTEGLEAVTMRRVAQELDTGPASLYAHVKNKVELHELMMDRVIGKITLPEPDPARWREQLRALAQAHANALITHPGIAKVAMSTMIPTGPNLLRHGEAMLALLHVGGLPDRQAAFGCDALNLYIKSFAHEASIWASGELDEADIQRRSEQLMAYLDSLPPDSFPRTIQMHGLFSEETATERFEFGLDILISGLAGKAVPAQS